MGPLDLPPHTRPERADSRTFSVQIRGGVARHGKVGVGSWDDREVGVRGDDHEPFLTHPESIFGG